jgi:hypothetical protein
MFLHLFTPRIDKQIIADCLGSEKDCKNCIYCSADNVIWQELEKKFERNSEFSYDLDLYYKIKHKRIPFEQEVKNSELQLSESEVSFFLRRY